MIHILGVRKITLISIFLAGRFVERPPVVGRKMVGLVAVPSWSAEKWSGLLVEKIMAGFCAGGLAGFVVP